MDLSHGARPSNPTAAQRRDALILTLVVAGHLLVLTHFSPSAKPPVPTVPRDLPVLTVSLMPALASPDPPAPTAAEPTPSPPAPTAPPLRPTPDQAPVDVAQLAAPGLPLSPGQFTAVSLTAEPVPISATPAPSGPPVLAAATEAQSQACDFTGALQDALQRSQAVRDEISHIPRQARSVANAIMLWDGRWAALETPGYPPMTDPLHQTILSLVRSLPSDCQTQPVAGPRLLTLAGPEGTTVIALGSGVWRWSDLLASAAAHR